MGMGRPISYVLTNEKRPYFSFVTNEESTGKEGRLLAFYRETGPWFQVLTRPDREQSEESKS